MRQLAAILFADMTGYTSLMQVNEQLAREKRLRLKEVLESVIQQHHGRILQYYGDGSLSIFQSAIDCVQSAVEIQSKLQQEPKVDIRVGIHTGDVIIEDEAIYGDGVNLASRIESLAVPGSILISEKVRDEIKNHPSISTRELGYFELKNVSQPIRVFAVSNEGIIVPGRDDLRGKTKPPKNRLAVLPFVNLSADPENEFFSDGITEELLNALTRIDGLQVTSRTSVFAFKGKTRDVRDIAIQLNVDKVLEGSVRKSGNRVRITAQLINAADGYHLWSENYDRNLTDIFKVQDEISAIIADRLRENLGKKPKEEQLVKAPTRNITAYTWYLKGLHYWNKLTPADCRRAIECFDQAITAEPGYAQAYAMSAGAYSYLGSTGQMLPDAAFQIVHRHADKALALDSDIAESHMAKANAYLFYDWKLDKAYESLTRALSINPAATDAYELLSIYHIIMGNKEEAVRTMEKAEQMDPLSPTVAQALSNMYMFAERYDDAIRQADKLLEFDPSIRACIETKGWCTGMKGDWKKALEYFEEVHRLTNHPLKGLMGVGYACARLGQLDRAMDVVRKLEQRATEEPDSVIDGDLATVWAGIGDSDKVFYYMNRCIDKRVGPVTYFLEYPNFKEFKKDPRYQQVRQRLGL